MKLRLPSDYQPSSCKHTLYWLELEIVDVEDRVESAIRTSEEMCPTYIDLQKDNAQIAREYRILLAFRDRLRTLPKPLANVTVAPGELPLSFNEEIFDGRFLSVDCSACGNSREAQGTVVSPFSEDTGMQYYGFLRSCPCGQAIAHRIDGYRSP